LAGNSIVGCLAGSSIVGCLAGNSIVGCLAGNSIDPPSGSTGISRLAKALWDNHEVKANQIML